MPNFQFSSFLKFLNTQFLNDLLNQICWDWDWTMGLFGTGGLGSLKIVDLQERTALLN